MNQKKIQHLLKTIDTIKRPKKQIFCSKICACGCNNLIPWRKSYFRSKLPDYIENHRQKMGQFIIFKPKQIPNCSTNEQDAVKVETIDPRDRIFLPFNINSTRCDQEENKIEGELNTE